MYMRTSLTAVLLVVMMAGCASYNHSIIAPPAYERTITGETTQVDRDGLGYTFQTWDSDRLLVTIKNPAGSPPVQVLGEQSWLVTPDGESRAIPSQAIAPGAHLSLQLPPERKRYESNPSFGVGLGTGFGTSGVGLGTGVGIGTGSDVYVTEQPWQWPAGQEVQLQITYRRDGQTFSHSWTFGKMKKN